METRRAKVGAKTFLREWIDGAIPDGIMHPITEAPKSVLKNVVMALRGHKGPTCHVFLGHDFGLILRRELLFGGKSEELPWSDYLDGFVLVMESGTTVRGLWWNRGMTSTPLRI